MGPDLILANAFRITIRDLADPGPLESGLREVAAEGFLNYFDDQRFRSYDPERGFFAEKILRGHWNGALQVLLTSITPDLPGWEKERRAELFRVWKDWPACLARAEGFLEKEIFSFLREHPAEFGLALHRVPEDEVSMQFAVLQGHLWNELLRRLVVRKAARTREVAGREGPYVFWESPHPGLSAFLKELELPTAAVRMSWPDEVSASLFAEILREKGLKPGDFRTRELRRVRFKSFPRRAVVFPDKLEVREKGGDELHPGRKRLTLAFELPRGSYATILVKRISG
jgi:tRNA pseudouridine13 synthase